MIAFIKGKIIHKDQTYFIIEVGNIGYEIKISLNTFSELKDTKECGLFTYLQIKEDSHTLYGFKDISEKKSFISLISVKGVGPNVALSILSSININDLASAIATEDVNLIKSVKGVGAKMAQRIILELKDKIGKMSESLEYSQNTNQTKLREEGMSALVKLGISKSIAEKSINEIIKKEGKDIDIETLLKLALTPI